MEEIKILGISLFQIPVVCPKGHTLLARFTVQLGYITISGATLKLSSENGEPFWGPPPIFKDRGKLYIHDREAYAQVTRAAMESFEEAGGTATLAEGLPPGVKAMLDHQLGDGK